ncbi:MAG: hypothetical protein ABIS50_08205 [Luteolibacter sp.]|uniref:hypothetical protein n=1 Tax=Luteolibacter sp. TaxID=1962973 RepID=UPI0032648D9D
MKPLAILCFSAVTAALSSCVSTGPSARGHASSPESVAVSSGVGSSYRNAITINARSEAEGVPAEYEWLEAHFPGSKVLGQSLANNAGKAYDVMHVQLASGQKRDVYFDISGFFGKS